MRDTKDCERESWVFKPGFGQVVKEAGQFQLEFMANLGVCSVFLVSILFMPM